MATVLAGPITAEMRAAIAACKLCFAATVNADGTPNVSPKASLMVYDEAHLVFANIASPTTIANLRRNPAIEINVVDIFVRKGFRFKGTARIVPPGGGPEYDFVARPFWAKNGSHYPVYQVVAIRVDYAAALLSPAYLFNDTVQQEDVRRVYLAEYGVKDAS